MRISDWSSDVCSSDLRVLPIGGLKEKLLAALRGGLKTVLIPKDNEKDLAEIPDNVKKNLTILPMTNLDDVLKAALVREVVPIEWIDPADVDQVPSVKGDGEEESVIRH